MAKGKKTKPWFLYKIESIIVDVGDYFGITTRPFDREREHWRGKGRAKMRAAITLYGPENFVFKVIARYPDELSARQAEKDFIRRYNTAWPFGLNVLSAGKGVYSHPDYLETYERRSKSQIKVWADEQLRADLAAAQNRVWSDPERRLAQSVRQKKLMSDPAMRERISLALTGTTLARETIEKISAESKKRWDIPGYREKMAKSHANRKRPSRESIEKTKAGIKRHYDDEDNREKSSERAKKSWSGDSGALRKQKLQERWANPEFKKRSMSARQKTVDERGITEETRSKQSEARRKWWERHRLIKSMVEES